MFIVIKRLVIVMLVIKMFVELCMWFIVYMMYKIIEFLISVMIKIVIVKIVILICILWGIGNSWGFMFVEVLVELSGVEIFRKKGISEKFS